MVKELMNHWRPNGIGFTAFDRDSKGRVTERGRIEASGTGRACKCGGNILQVGWLHVCGKCCAGLGQT